MKQILILSLLILSASCSLAPFSATTSGRSLGPGKVQAELGNSNASYYLRFGYGISESMDLGYVMEFGSFTTSGIYGKYSFINNETGPSLAMELGYGGTETSTYYYAGAIGSLAFSKAFEVFVNPRINKVETDEQDIEIGDSVGNVTINAENVTYLYVSAGFNVWFSEVAGLTIYTVYVTGQDIETEEPSTVGGSFLFRF